MDFIIPDRLYLERRTLRHHARVLQLWTLGVGAVISGDFFGWNLGFIEGGFGGMFGVLCFSIAEMSAALPHTGGAYSFARTAVGPRGGYITRLTENMEYILTPAVIVVAIGGDLGAIAGTLNSDHRPGLLGAAVRFLLGIAWFAAGGRKRLVLAPEEKFAEEVRAAP